MHQNISHELASQHVADLVRASERRRSASGTEFTDGSFVRRAYSRYFGRARKGHVESVRRSVHGAGGAGAGLI